MHKEITISCNDANQRLDRFLLKHFNKLTRIGVYKLIRTKDIKVNNKRTDHAYILKENDVISIFTNEKYLQRDLDLNFQYASDELDIIYEDEHLLVVHKPVGLIVHDDANHQNDTLQNRIKKYLARKRVYNPFDESAFIPALCHRLDLNTSGLIIAAKTAAALRLITAMFKNNDVIRTYKCMTYTALPKTKDLVYLYMHKSLTEPNLMIVSDFKTKANKTAVTAYNFIKKHNNYYVYDVQLHTGRTHQIRAVLNYLKAPLVGETKYIHKSIDKDPNYQHQCLASSYLQLTNIKKYNQPEFNYLANKAFALKTIWFLE